jgi:hypothetical protein
VANGGEILVPCGDVVAEPVANIRSSANERAARDDHRPFVRSSVEHTLSTCFAHHGSVSVHTYQNLPMHDK